MSISRHDIARRIDHAVLRPDARTDDFEEGCRLALEYGVAALCVPSGAVHLVVPRLQGSPVATCAVVGFPHGNASTLAKLSEADYALFDGARELDVVVPIGRVLSEEWPGVEEEMALLTRRTHDAKALIKFIFENGYLQDAHKVRLCRLASDLGADFVKTSTGFGPTVATEQDVRLMREHCPPSVGVKASGGIKTLEQVLAFQAWGAGRIGTSSTRAILEAVET